MLDFPAGTRDSPAYPFWRMCGASVFTVEIVLMVLSCLGKVNSIPKDERIVLLDSDAGVCANLRLENA